MNISTSDTSSQKTRGYFLLALLLGTGVVLFEMTKLFLVPVALAATFAGLFYPLYTKLVPLTRGREGLSALTSCVVLLVGLLPAYIVTDLAVQESLGIYKSAGRWTSNLLNSKDSLNLSERLNQFELLQGLELNHLDWQQPLQDAIKTTAGWSNKLHQYDLAQHATVGRQLLYYALHYVLFFSRRSLLLRRLHQLSPLEPRYERGLIRRFVSVSRATIKDSLYRFNSRCCRVGITLWAFDFSSPALWGVVMVVLSIIPLVGTWMVYIRPDYSRCSPATCGRA